MLQQILRAPALKAILIQVLAFPLMLLLVYGLARAGVAMSLPVVALLQGVLAALITWRAGLARWWCAIGLLFAPALLAASLLHWPPVVFLVAFVFLLSLYWSTFRTQVPFYPSGPRVWHAVAELIADIEDGVLVTELIGHGVNGVTGDYSRGASGFRIVRGEIAGPVAEFTVAGNLIEMFAHLSVADDLEWHRSVNVPTIRIDGMTVAGD